MPATFSVAYNLYKGGQSPPMADVALAEGATIEIPSDGLTWVNFKVKAVNRNLVDTKMKFNATGIIPLNRSETMITLNNGIWPDGEGRFIVGPTVMRGLVACQLLTVQGDRMSFNVRFK